MDYNYGCCPIQVRIGPCTPSPTMLTAAMHDCLPRGPPSRVVDLQQFWPSRHPRSSSLRLPARCFRLHRLSIALHQSQLYFKPKSRTQHMSFTSSSTTNPNRIPLPLCTHPQQQPKQTVSQTESSTKQHRTKAQNSKRFVSSFQEEENER